MSVDVQDLKEGGVYLIRYNFDKYRHYEGTFSQTRTINGELKPEFINCHCYIRQVEHIDHYSDSHYCIDIRDHPNSINVFSSVARANFYDAKKVKTFDKVKNLQKAIQSRERRTVNMILKRLVNEDFEW